MGGPPPALTLWGVCGVDGGWGEHRVGSGVCVWEVVWCGVCVCVGGVAWVKHYLQ